MEFVLWFTVLAAAVLFITKMMFWDTVTWPELGIGAGIQLIVVALLYYGGTYAAGMDTEILNGQVTDKYRDRVSCSHSYSCNCRTVCSGTGSNKTCSRTCDTCYEHSYDYDWVVKTSVGNLTIDRVNRQGTVEPPRFSKVIIGEHAAVEHSFYNYIKASPLTIFDKSKIESTLTVPEYITVHDYYRVNRVINFQSEYIGDFNQLNDALNEGLKTLGFEKKLNVVVVFHKFGSDFTETTKAKLYGGKLNDVYVMINADKDGVIRSTNVFSWSKNDMVNVATRDDILSIEKLGDMSQLAKVILADSQKFFVKRSADEFKYLSDNVELNDTAMWILFVFGIVFPLGWAYAAHKHLDIR